MSNAAQQLRELADWLDAMYHGALIPGMRANAIKLRALADEVDALQSAMQEIVEVASGERQVADDDTEGMAWIDKRARRALAGEKA